MDLNIEIDVKIEAILISCDESIANVNIGSNYTIIKMKQNELPFIDNIIDARGNLNTDYFPSRIIEQDGYGDIVSFMCLQKEDKFTVPAPEIKAGISYSDKDLDQSEYLEKYQDKEFEYLNTIISLLQIFKNGNIGLKEIFFTFTYKPLGFVANTHNMTINIKDANTIKQDAFILSEQETVDCNLFIHNYFETEFIVMKNIIDEYTFGLKQIDKATGFEQFTTALEMIFLEKNQQSKKEVLSKRVSALLGTSNAEITALYNKMKSFYRFRSESLHEGDGTNITVTELDELEDITRMVLNKYLAICSNAIASNPCVTWDKIKETQIITLKSLVVTLIRSGILPT
jgi:hypothetical protein